MLFLPTTHSTSVSAAVVSTAPDADGGRHRRVSATLSGFWPTRNARGIVDRSSVSGKIFFFRFLSLPPTVVSHRPSTRFSVQTGRTADNDFPSGVSWTSGRRDVHSCHCPVNGAGPSALRLTYTRVGFFSLAFSLSLSLSFSLSLFLFLFFSRSHWRLQPDRPDGDKFALKSTHRFKKNARPLGRNWFLFLNKWQLEKNSNS